MGDKGDYESRRMQISQDVMHMIGDFETLKSLLSSGIPEGKNKKKKIKEILSIFKFAIDRAHFLARLQVIGAHRLLYKLKFLRHYVRWAIRHNMKLDRPAFLINMIENRMLSVQQQLKESFEKDKIIEFAIPR